MTMIAYAFLQSRRLAEASGEKESAKDRLSRHCPRSAAPSSPSSLARRPTDAPIAGERSEDASNKSAKVVLALVAGSWEIVNRPILGDHDGLGRSRRALGFPLSDCASSFS